MTLVVELWHVPGCPLVDQVRTALRECMDHTGATVPVLERQGPYPSPTLIVNGVDVVTGTAPGDHACCRLDLPTHDQIHTALAAALSTPS